MAVFQTEFFSHSLRRLVPVNICLPVETPPGMPGESDPQPFKTLYLLHGFSGGHNDWLWGAPIHQLAREHRLAVVMPSGENSFYLDDMAREAFYGRFVGQELVEFTRRVFPLSHKREDTLIGGLSMGGYGAIRNGLHYADVFGAILGLSSALITKRVAQMQPGEGDAMSGYAYYAHTFGEPARVKGSDADPVHLARQLMAEQKALPRLYMACGTEDFLLQENRDFAAALTAMGYPHTYCEGPGVHDWLFWSDYIQKALQWYAKPE